MGSFPNSPPVRAARDIVLCLAILFLLPALAADTPSLDDLPERSLREIRESAALRMGGRGNLGALQSVVIQQTMQRESGETVEMAILKKRPYFARVTLTHELSVITQAFDGERVWMRQQGAGVDRSRFLPSRDGYRFVREHTLLPLFLLPMAGELQMEVTGRVRFGMFMCYEVHVRFPDGDRYEYLIDGSEFIVRRIIRFMTNEGSSHRIQIIPLDYDYVSGVLFPFRLIYFVDGRRDAVIRVQAIQTNVGLLAETFALPRIMPDAGGGEDAPEGEPIPPNGTDREDASQGESEG